eukprot:Hpha_TRINITY_DN16763_c4_g9::TRINITY_DN16763_c4_g9_i1::g.79613::m.79613
MKREMTGDLGASKVDKCFRICSAWIMRASDTAEDAHIKRIGTPVAMVMVPVFSYMMLGEWDWGRDVSPMRVGIVCYLAALVQFFVRGCLGMRMKVSVEILIGLGFVACILHDMVLASELSGRVWSGVIILLDLTLVFNTPRTMVILPLTLAYLLLDNFERALRFGFYDAVASETPDVCKCANPPCALGADNILTGWSVAVFVLLADFHFTRGFAIDLRYQLRRVKAAVDVAAEVTAALARYDVDGAESAIAKGKELPEELAKSFVQLVGNLSSYKAYLPDSCLLPRDAHLYDDPGAAAQALPGGG